MSNDSAQLWQYHATAPAAFDWRNLFLEYEDVMKRESLFRRSPLSRNERQQLFEAFLSVCEWVNVYFYWRPNLRDESDNHIMELAVAVGQQQSSPTT